MLSSEIFSWMLEAPEMDQTWGKSKIHLNLHFLELCFNYFYVEMGILKFEKESSKLIHGLDFIWLLISFSAKTVKRVWSNLNIFEYLSMEATFLLLKMSLSKAKSLASKKISLVRGFSLSNGMTTFLLQGEIEESTSGCSGGNAKDQ